MAHVLKKIPKVGSTVLCDGELCMIRGFAAQKSATNRGMKEIGKFEGALLVAYEGPRFFHKGRASDLRYDEELDLFYGWGRILSYEQKAQVIKLRDQGRLPARETRNPGNAPAGGEHMNLYKALFAGPGPVDKVKIAAYGKLFKLKLAEGYADPDADDSTGEVNHD